MAKISIKNITTDFLKISLNTEPVCHHEIENRAKCKKCYLRIYARLQRYLVVFLTVAASTSKIIHGRHLRNLLRLWMIRLARYVSLHQYLGQYPQITVIDRYNLLHFVTKIRLFPSETNGCILQTVDVTGTAFLQSIAYQHFIRGKRGVSVSCC